MAKIEYKGYKVTKRTDGRWHSRVTVNGERKSIYGKTQVECYDKLKQFINSIKIIKNKKITLEDYYLKWLNTYKKPSITISTLNTIKSIFKNHILPTLGDKDINKLTPLEVNTLINSKVQRVKEYVSQYLIAILKQAHQDKILKEDFTPSLIKYHSKRNEGKALTFEQRKIFLEQCKNINHGNIFLFYFYSGARPSEGLRFAPGDIFENSIRIPGTKTEKSDRIIPLFKPLKELFSSMKIDKRAKTVFRISEKTLDRELIKLTKLCKFKFSTKDLRTTFGTMCAEIGIPDVVIAKWMGHSTTQTTKKYYIKVQSKFEQEQIEIFDTNFDTNFNPKKDF